MQHSARIQSVIEILDAFQGTEAPADAVLGKYFRDRRYIGSKDKKFIAELFYNILRRYFEVEWLIASVVSDYTTRDIVIAALRLFGNRTVDEVATYFNGENYSPEQLDPNEMRILKKLNPENIPENIKLNYPSWLEDKLKETFGADFENEINALNQQAPLDLRVNTLKSTRENVVVQLAEDGITASPTTGSPIGLRIMERTPVFATKAFKDGLLEVQDEGSQLVSMMVDAKPGQTIVDFCAGAGGKTLSIAAQMNNKGRVYAFDVGERRLEECEKRLRRAGIHNTTVKRIESETDKCLKRLHNMADAVLVDAPCSGSGTWRRSPDLKIRLTPEKLEKLLGIQTNILDSAAKLVRTWGRLIYVTCSTLPDENERQVEAFIARNPKFELLETKKLTPYKNGTDGFFVAIMRLV